MWEKYFDCKEVFEKKKKYCVQQKKTRWMTGSEGGANPHIASSSSTATSNTISVLIVFEVPVIVVPGDFVVVLVILIRGFFVVEGVLR